MSTINNGRIVVFTSAKMVVVAPTSNRNPYIISPLLFSSTYPYPVAIKIITIFRKKIYEKHQNILRRLSKV